jgi:hypothetical protein
VARVARDTGTETSRDFENTTDVGTDHGPGTAIPAPRAPWHGATSTVPKPTHGAGQQVNASGPFTGLVAALKTVTAPRPVVPTRQGPPDGGRILGVCAWAALLDLAGLVIGFLAAVSLIASSPPGWYLPSLLISGAAGIAVTSAAFLTVRVPRVPWVLLLLGTASLITSAVLTGNAT